MKAAKLAAWVEYLGTSHMGDHYQIYMGLNIDMIIGSSTRPVLCHLTSCSCQNASNNERATRRGGASIEYPAASRRLPDAHTSSARLPSLQVYPQSSHN